MTTQATFSAATWVLKNSSRTPPRRPARRSGRGTRTGRGPVDLGGEGPEAELVGADLARHGHREQSPSMEGVLEDDDRLATGRVPGDLDRVLERLGAAVGEQGLLGVRARRDGVQLLGQGDVAFVRSHAEARVRELLELGGGRPDDLGVRVAHVQGPDAAGEVEQDVSVHVGQQSPPGARRVNGG